MVFEYIDLDWDEAVQLEELVTFLKTPMITNHSKRVGRSASQRQASCLGQHYSAVLCFSNYLYLFPLHAATGAARRAQ